MSAEQQRPRSVSKDDIVKRASTLKKVTTKEFIDAVSKEDLEALAKVFQEKKGDFKALAEACHADAKLIEEIPPDNAEHFAQLLFSGAYLSDKTEAAKDNLRQSLFIAIKNTRAALKKSITRSSIGPSSDDLKAAAQLYTDCQGDFAKVAEKCGLKESLLDADPPFNAEEFAQKVFAGNYTEEVTEASKDKLRTVLRPEIMARRPSLRRSTTKEHTGAASDEDIALVAKMYTADAAALEEVATKMGLTVALLKAKPPKDAEEFAKNALEGAYTEDESESSKKDFRANLLAGIMQRRPSLKPAPQRQRMLSHVTVDELTNFGSFFKRFNGDLAGIAKESGLPFELLKSSPPTNADDFISKLLDGTYTFEMDEQSKLAFRTCLRKEMSATISKLKKVPTKEWDGSANEKDISLFANIYTQRKGDLEQLAQAFGLSLTAMQTNPPENDKEFAKNVLLGVYTPDSVAKLIDEFRQGMGGQLKVRSVESLKQVETKMADWKPKPGEIAKIAKIYGDLKGDLAQCARAVGVDYGELSKSKPIDANDFAVKVLAGAYSTEEMEGVRRHLSEVLHQDMAQHAGLKKADTKEKVVDPKEADVAHYADIFDEHEGNLPKLASVLGCDIELLRKDAPADAKKFAMRYLVGGYQK